MPWTYYTLQEDTYSLFDKYTVPGSREVEPQPLSPARRQLLLDQLRTDEPLGDELVSLLNTLYAGGVPEADLATALRSRVERLPDGHPDLDYLLAFCRFLDPSLWFPFDWYWTHLQRRKQWEPTAWADQLVVSIFRQFPPKVVIKTTTATGRPHHANASALRCVHARSALRSATAICGGTDVDQNARSPDGFLVALEVFCGMASLSPHHRPDTISLRFITNTGSLRGSPRDRLDVDFIVSTLPERWRLYNRYSATTQQTISALIAP